MKELYGTVDRIEYYPGIFAEDTRTNSALPSLIGRLVGVDAFSQALTNPLLASNIYNERTFTRAGLEIIESTQCLSDILHRNLPAGSPRFEVSMGRDETGPSPRPPSRDRVHGTKGRTAGCRDGLNSWHIHVVIRVPSDHCIERNPLAVATTPNHRVAKGRGRWFDELSKDAWPTRRDDDAGHP